MEAVYVVPPIRSFGGQLEGLLRLPLNPPGPAFVFAKSIQRSWNKKVSMTRFIQLGTVCIPGCLCVCVCVRACTLAYVCVVYTYVCVSLSLSLSLSLCLSFFLSPFLSLPSPFSAPCGRR